mmetsp:Transcript_20029/g.63748  ORF Transcript_20029/g.63748 Transcript_20029/m.63748 type:complete len:95 (-) Transcript_20029:280-564(-)
MAVNEGRPRRVLTSLSLEVTLYFGGWYDIFYCLATLVVYIYKGSELPYPDSNFRMEVAFLFLLALVEPCRLFLGAPPSPFPPPAGGLAPPRACR